MARRRKRNKRFYRLSPGGRLILDQLLKSGKTLTHR